MSNELVRLYRIATCAPREAGASDQTTAAVAAADDNTFEQPRSIYELERLLDARYGSAHAPKIYWFVMHTKIQFRAEAMAVHPTPYNVLTEFTLQEPTHRHLVTDAASARLPLALAIDRISYDAERMPIDIQLQLTGLQPQFVVDAVAPASSPPLTRAPRRASEQRAATIQLRDDLLRARERVPRAGPGHALLASVRMFRDAISGATFSSIEALGFSAAFLFATIVTPVGEELARRYQRLLWPSRFGTFSPSSSNRSLHTSASPAFYWLPVSYKYTPLLRNVHAYLAAQTMCRDPSFDPTTADTSACELPATNSRVLFEYTALHAAVDFIESHLIGVHPRINPRELLPIPLPFTSLNWASAERERSALGIVKESLADMELCVEHAVYYAFIDNAEEAPESLGSASVSPSLESQGGNDNDDDNTIITTSTITDSYDDDDDDASLEFQTPRSAPTTARSTPRPLTLTGFLDMSGAPQAHETLIDHYNMRTSPLRASPARSAQPSTRSSALDLIGTAQSDDCSEPSPGGGDTTESITPSGSEPSSSSVQTAVMRSILDGANKRLRATSVPIAISLPEDSK